MTSVVLVASYGFAAALAIVALFLGMALLLKKFKSTAPTPVIETNVVMPDLFLDRAQLVKERGTLDDELSDADRAWVIWPTGTIVPGLREATIKKLERAVLTDIIKPCDFAPYSHMLTVGSYPFRLNLYNATKAITDRGGMVKWHRHPSMSVVIANPTGKAGWARIEILMPYTQAAERVNLLVKREREPELFERIVKSFEATWKNSVEPKFDEVTIPGGDTFTETS